MSFPRPAWTSPRGPVAEPQPERRYRESTTPTAPVRQRRSIEGGNMSERDELADRIKAAITTDGAWRESTDDGMWDSESAQFRWDALARHAADAIREQFDVTLKAEAQADAVGVAVTDAKAGEFAQVRFS